MRAFIAIACLFLAAPATAESDLAKEIDGLLRVPMEVAANDYKSCVIEAAEDLALKSVEAANLVAIAAQGRCREHLRKAVRAAVDYFQNDLAPDRAEQILRSEWTQRAIERIIEVRAAQR